MVHTLKELTVEFRDDTHMHKYPYHQLECDEGCGRNPRTMGVPTSEEGETFELGLEREEYSALAW